jgi:hypothetical protein
MLSCKSAERSCYQPSDYRFPLLCRGDRAHQSAHASEQGAELFRRHAFSAPGEEAPESFDADSSAIERGARRNRRGNDEYFAS